MDRDTTVINVWYSNWFSTITNIFELVGQESKYKIFASNERDTPMIAGSKYIEVWEQEPSKADDTYMTWCKHFINKHNINIIVPRKHKHFFLNNRKEFEDMGCKLILEDEFTEYVLEDKLATYERMKGSLDKYIPDYELVYRSSEIAEAYERLHSKYDRICIKKRIDEGACSFNEVIDGDIKYSYFVAGMYENKKISIKEIIRLVKEKEDRGDTLDAFLMMPYLKKEVSCDYIKYGDKDICIVRESGHNHTTLVSTRDEYVHAAKEVYEHFSLKGMANIQFRHTDSAEIKLLEVNARMSGGLQKSCLASEINLPVVMLENALGNYNYACENKLRPNEVIIIATEEKPSIIARGFYTE